ncbi:hypothetical protein [Haloferax sp. YSMS24]|uniref:hypothetical protein n=1 Tax=unclassified Haloferax TaxID=2625095 RepID=UPI00398CD75F
MVSRENLTILAFVLVSFPAAYAVERLTGDFLVSYATIIVVGVVVPTAINEYRRTKRAQSRE